MLRVPARESRAISYARDVREQILPCQKISNPFFLKRSVHIYFFVRSKKVGGSPECPTIKIQFVKKMRQSVAGKNLAFFTFWNECKKIEVFRGNNKIVGTQGIRPRGQNHDPRGQKVTKQGHYNGIRHFVSSWCRYTSTAKNPYTTKNHEKWKYN